MTIHAVFGPTASGKTKVALSLAERFVSPLLSIDSRKVYSGMDIGTNKLELLTATKERGLTLLGVDIATPSETMSVYQFREKVATQIEELGYIPEAIVLFGGTGLYLDSLLFGLPLGASANAEIRADAETMSVEQLQQHILAMNPISLAKMNESDRQNPRRLQRLLEKLTAKDTEMHTVPDVIRSIFQDATVYFYLPKVDRTALDEKITKRVMRYSDEGWLSEVKELLSGFSSDSPGLSIMGYADIVRYVNLPIEEQTESLLKVILEKVAMIHRQYAKRQTTWAKRYLRDLNSLYKDAAYVPQKTQKLYYQLGGDIMSVEDEFSHSQWD
jgi:tRNA dimethylallyltransferase